MTQPADWLTERLASRRRPTDPDFDAFYDATDQQLAQIVHNELPTPDRETETR